MDSNLKFLVIRLRNRLLNKVIERSFEVKRGHSEPFTQQEVRSCKTGLKLLNKAHFGLANKVLKHYCPDMWQAVLE